MQFVDWKAPIAEVSEIVNMFMNQDSASLCKLEQ